MELKEQEEAFNIRHFGVRYICEFCHEGEMRYFSPGDDNAGLFVHRCTHCNKEMLLPKMYPYIEWVPGDKINKEDLWKPN